MRRYDDPVEVRTGDGASRGAGDAGQDRPEQFLWRGQLWQVRGVLAHWVETGEWWRSGRARAVAGTDRPVAVGGGRSVAGERRDVRGSDSLAELLDEREVWRVEARRPRPGHGGERVTDVGVFDLAREVVAGRWQLVGCAD